LSYRFRQQAAGGFVSSRYSPSAAALAPPAEQPGWKKQQRLEQGEERSHREAKKTKRQGQQPDQGKENQGEQRHGPAKHEQDAPQNKKQQDFHFLSFLIWRRSFNAS
jgi:hypothetical protein